MPLDYNRWCQMIHEFGPFRYDSDQRLLFRGADRLPLVPKVLETLHVLIERRGQVVEKQELMRLVWPDTTVEEIGLARNISLLRKTLEDDGGEPVWIETIPRRGYRFAPAAVSRPAGRRRLLLLLPAVAVVATVYYQFYVPSRFVPQTSGAALAVVPFECICPGEDGQSYVNAFTDLLAAELSKLPSVQVTAPSTVQRHRRAGLSMGLMGRLLGLDMLVEGSIHRLTAGRRFTVRLVDVHTGKMIWAESYEQSDQAVAQAAAVEIGKRLNR